MSTLPADAGENPRAKLLHRSGRFEIIQLCPAIAQESVADSYFCSGQARGAFAIAKRAVKQTRHSLSAGCCLLSTAAEKVQLVSSKRRKIALFEVGRGKYPRLMISNDICQKASALSNLLWVPSVFLNTDFSRYPRRYQQRPLLASITS